jgi:hypothetical protein
VTTPSARLPHVPASVGRTSARNRSLTSTGGSRLLLSTHQFSTRDEGRAQVLNELIRWNLRADPVVGPGRRFRERATGDAIRVEQGLGFADAPGARISGTIITATRRRASRLWSSRRDCTRITTMWQWYIHSPGRSSGTHAMRTRPIAGMLTVSSHERNAGGLRRWRARRSCPI